MVDRPLEGVWGGTHSRPGHQWGGGSQQDRATLPASPPPPHTFSLCFQLFFLQLLIGLIQQVSVGQSRRGVERMCAGEGSCLKEGGGGSWGGRTERAGAAWPGAQKPLWLVGISGLCKSLSQLDVGRGEWPGEGCSPPPPVGPAQFPGGRSGLSRGGLGGALEVGGAEGGNGRAPEHIMASQQWGCAQLAFL